MKRPLVRSAIAAMVVTAALIPGRASGVGAVAVYFDRALTQQFADCPFAPPGTVIDTLYVAASGFATPIEGIEYAITLPPEMIFIADTGFDTGLQMGQTPSGMTIAFLSPQDALTPVLIHEVIVLWMCEGCVAGNSQIEVTANPFNGELRAVTSDLAFENAVGITSLVCATVCKWCVPQTVAFVEEQPLQVEQCELQCPASDGEVVIPGITPGQHHTPDFNGSGMVGIVDFAEFGAAYYGVFDSEKDLYCSGNLDLIDFVLFARHWEHAGVTPVETTTWGKVKARYLE